MLVLLPATLVAQQSSTKADTARRLSAVRITAPSNAAAYATSSVGVTRTDLRLRDTPRAVSIVTRGLIADQAMQSMADVVRFTPGVTMGTGEGNRDAPTIRGNSTTADFYVDGTRDDAQYLRDLYNIERVEVLKGAESLLFGRGGGGGVFNRVTRQAAWSPVSSFTTELGSFDHKRATADVGRAVGDHGAGRVTGMFEQSGGFRDAATLTRFGVNPTLALMSGAGTMLRIGYEHFYDDRRADRGVPSFRGAPSDVDITTFFGNPSVNHASMRLNRANASLERATARGVSLRSRVSWGDFDKFYQNSYPGAMNAAGTAVSLSAYNHAIQRRNLLSVSDATMSFSTGALRHTLLVGADLSYQRTSQARRTGYFNDSSASMNVSVEAPTIATPIVFRQGATDADNRAIVNDAAVYVQDQIALTEHWLAVAGIRAERFGIAYHNNRTLQDLDRTDDLVSPRAGLVFKPVQPVSLYASYGTSHLPGSGDQFTSLTVTTAALEPERFTNRELGVKWDVARALSMTGAIYRLDRTNTSAPDPADPSITVQTGAQRTTGWELSAAGAPMRAWNIAAGVGSQRAMIVSTTKAAKAGASVALVPATTASLWNRVQVTRRLGAGVGVIHQTKMYAAVDNSVILPGFTRIDGALYAAIAGGVRAQLNVENLFDARYYPTTQGNNNIMPGAPRTVRVGVTVAPGW